MRYVPFGVTGVQVSPLCLGTMMFGSWGNTDRGECIATIQQALDAGINFVDTANVYSGGESEEILGQALRGRRDSVVLATKFHAPMGPGPNDRGNSRKHIFQAVEASLRRLGTDYLDLYQAHRLDPDMDIAETLGALSDLVHQGKVRWIGSSTFPPSAIVAAQWAAERKGLERFVCEQPPYSILVREAEREVLPTVLAQRMAAIVWSPLAGGWLSGKFRRGQPTEASGRAARTPARFDLSMPENRAKLDAVEALVPLAGAEGVSLPVLALAWVVTHPAVTAAIIGPRNREQLSGLLAAAEVTLSAATLDAIDAVVAPGHTLNRADLGFDNVWLRPESRRRPAG
ncbi:MAG TPA: aldo/keto reductase [Actinomycetota bacterium]|nr:aldo/keto reductase [Actinomycetota bacterium]